MTEMIELADKAFKVAVINVLKNVKENMKRIREVF